MKRKEQKRIGKARREEKRRGEVRRGEIEEMKLNRREKRRMRREEKRRRERVDLNGGNGRYMTKLLHHGHFFHPASSSCLLSPICDFFMTINTVMMMIIDMIMIILLIELLLLLKPSSLLAKLSFRFSLRAQPHDIITMFFLYNIPIVIYFVPFRCGSPFPCTLLLEWVRCTSIIFVHKNQ